MAFAAPTRAINDAYDVYYVVGCQNCSELVYCVSRVIFCQTDFSLETTIDWVSDGSDGFKSQPHVLLKQVAVSASLKL